jgi:ubiquinone/menaquinone biosynthesis C-methylase UbiE
MQKSYISTPFFATLYEWSSRRRSFTNIVDPQRRQIATMATGKVIEIGAGGGQNFSFYDPERITDVEATEPDPQMIRYAKQRISSARVAIHMTQACAEQLPFPAETFDTALATFVLCSVQSVDEVLQEIRRVLKQNGTLLLYEHVRHSRQWIATAQTALTPIQRRLVGNCHLNRDIKTALIANGFMISREDISGSGLLPMRLYVANITNA